MPYGAPTQSGVYIPNHDASGRLVIGYSRNVAKWPLLNYMEVRRTTQPRGYYLRLQPNEGGRTLYNDIRMNLWPDGEPAPSGVENNQLFTWFSFETFRMAYPYLLGHKTVGNASWDIKASHRAVQAQKAMTNRTKFAKATLDAASWGSNTAAVDGGLLTGGQNWSNGTETSPNIKKSLLLAAQVINKQTFGVINPQDLVLVIDPVSATEMATTQEIHSYLARSMFAEPTIRDRSNWNAQWGLPPELYGFKLVVDNTVQDPTLKGATPNPGYIYQPGTAYLLSRPGGLDGGADPSVQAHSTLTGFFYEEMTVEEFDDPNNRLFTGRVVDDYSIVVTSELTGFRLTSTGLS